MKYKGLWITLAVIGVIAIIGAAVFLGFFFGRRSSIGPVFSFNRTRFNFPSMMRGMQWQDNDLGCNTGALAGCSWNTSGSSELRVISIEEAEQAVSTYINEYDSDDHLHISEIMIFDNHAYAVVKEEETGIGAFEVLVDPETLTVYPEMGPNMMWNLKYGHMASGMMNNSAYSNPADMPISEAEAVQLANDYLADIGSNLVADDHPDQFYGYYTLHTTVDGEIYGMLSVNGYSGDIFLHTWHGQFIEMTEHADEH